MFARALVLLSAVLLCVASASTSSFRPRSISAPGATDDDIYTAAVRVLGDRGVSMRTQDRQSGLLVGEWTDVQIGLPGSTSTQQHAWRVTVRDGQARVLIDCRMPVSIGEGWTDCGDYRADAWTAQVGPILRDIKAEAMRIVAQRQGGETSPASSPASQPASQP
jgi:hypothetical protein